jgi:hypothetical protein
MDSTDTGYERYLKMQENNRLWWEKELATETCPELIEILEKIQRT